MNTIAENIAGIKKTLPSGCRLVAVSKFHPAESVSEAYVSGQRIFGESRVQELTMKAAVLPSDIEWHFIGHLQTNKVKMIIPFISMIHSIDSLRLLKEVDKAAALAGRIVPCLLQLHIAREETKYGFSFDECRVLLSEGEWKNLKNIRISGLMGMATLTENEDLIKSEFISLRNFFCEIKDCYFAGDASFCEISMGMSDDYPLAVECGSTMVRVGSRIFGERIY